MPQCKETLEMTPESAKAIIAKNLPSARFSYDIFSDRVTVRWPGRLTVFVPELLRLPQHAFRHLVKRLQRHERPQEG